MAYYTTDVKVGTYNIFLTTDKQLASTFAKSYISYSKFLEDYGSSENVAFLGTGENSGSAVGGLNVLEFEHEFAFGKNNDSKITLKTYEPGLEVLKRLFFLYVGEKLSELKYRKEALENLEERTWTPLLKEAGFTHTLKSARGQFEEENPGKYKETIRQEITKNLYGQVVYIAYGIGDDLKYWAGPYQTIFGRLGYTNNGKKELLTYTFVTDHVKAQFDEIVEGVEKNTVTFKKIALPLIAWNLRPTAPLGWHPSLEPSQGPHADPETAVALDDPRIDDHTKALYKIFKRYRGHQVVFEGFTPSLHDNIVKLISNYLYQIGIKNHIIVLPNLDQLFAPLVWTVFRNNGEFPLAGDSFLYLHDFVTGGGLADEWVPPTGVQGPEALLITINSYFNELFLLNHKLWGPTNPNVIAQPIHDQMILVMKVIGALGAKGNNQASDDTDPVEPRVNFGSMDPNLSMNWVDPGGFDGAGIFATKAQHEYDVDLDTIPLSDPFSDTDPGEIDQILSLELPIIAEEEKDTSFAVDGGTYMNAVDKFLDRILSVNGERLVNLTSFWENQLSVVEKFKEKFGSGTFAGYKQNVKDDLKRQRQAGGSPAPPLEISDDAFFILGDEQLIRDYLYGNIVNHIRHDFGAASITSQITRGVPMLSQPIKQWPNYFLDPFWNRIAKDLADITVTEVTAAQLRDPVEQTEYDPKGLWRDKAVGSYFGEINKVVNPPGVPTPLGYFQDFSISEKDFPSILPDEFSILEKEVATDAVETIFEQQIPFFIANDENANILSYSFDADNFIFNQFFNTIEEIYFNTAYRYALVNSNFTSVTKPSSTDYRNKFYKILDDFRLRGGLAGGNMQKWLHAGKAINITAASTELADILLTETTGLVDKVRKGYGSEVISLVLLFQGLFEKQYKGVIKTLPMFHISTLRNILKPAIVLIKSTPRIKLSSEMDRSTSDFFSGIYKIAGFKHSIAKNKATSEFVVIKDIASMLTDES